MHPTQSPQRHYVRPRAVPNDDSPPLHFSTKPRPFPVNPVTHSLPQSIHDSVQSFQSLTDMKAVRKAFRSLRSFTVAGRHPSGTAEIVSDPIVDDDPSPTLESAKLHRTRQHPSIDEIVVDSETPIKHQEFLTSSKRELHLGFPHPSRLTASVPQSSTDNHSNLLQVDTSNEPHVLSSSLGSRERKHKSTPLLSAPYSMSTDLEATKSQRSKENRSLQIDSFSQHPVTDLTASVIDKFASPVRTPSQLSRDFARDGAPTRRTRRQTQHAHPESETPIKRGMFQGEVQPISLEDVKKTNDAQNKERKVFDLEEVAETPEVPAVKRRRTRSSSRRSRRASLSPEVDDLLLRQLMENATDGEKQVILAASGSSRGRRKLRQLFVNDEDEDMQRENGNISNASKEGDVEWLGTSYDSVEEVVPTPSPQTKRKRRPYRLQDIGVERHEEREKPAIVERIDTSESPERILRRRSRRLSRKVTRSRKKPDAGIETIDSSSSPGPKMRRSRRIARISELPLLDEGVHSNDSDQAASSGESAVEKGLLSARAKKLSGRSRSRPLPMSRAGVLRDRLRRRKPILPIKRKPTGNLRKKSATRVESSIDREPSGLRRSTRLRRANTRARNRPVVDADADDEVIEEGSADNDNEDDECTSAEEEVVVEEVEDEEEEEGDSEIQLDDAEDDEGDEDDEDDDTFEEREWKEQLKSKQLRRKRKQNGGRKRTQPRDVFRTEGEHLTAREQKERLDFLVTQSADIASHLHKVMADASKRSASIANVAPGQVSIIAAPTAEKSEAGDNSVGTSGSTTRDVCRDLQNEDSDVGRKEESFVSPSGLGCELQPHQKEGIDWLLTLDAQGLNAILADEMGLGKTIQAVSFLASLVLSGSRGPHLVVAPKNVCQHWADEVRKWYPNVLTVVTHLGSAEDRLETLKRVLEEDNFDILVTSFDHALRDLFTRKRRDGISWEHLQVLRAFRKVEFEYLVVDEAHRLKNDSSKINLGIRGYKLAQRRLLLTGTPLSNNLRELWSLMNVLNPRIFSSKATFEAWFSAPFASKTKKRAKVSLTHAEQSVIVDRLHTVIRPFFRRRVRADVCPSFTSADEVVIRCPLSGLQRAIMFHLQRRATASEAGINNIIMAMRAASNHPYVVSDALFDGEQSLASEKLVASSGKFVFLHFALPRLISTGHRVLIFSQFRRVLDFIEDLLGMLGMKFGRLDGDTSSDDRTSGLAEFNRDGSDIPVFLLTTRAGGIGLNLQSADTVILFDSDWNPSADLQAVSRIQRIGQKRTVHILRLVTENSVDNLIVETARQKLRTQNVAVGAGKFNTSLGAALDTRMRQKDLEELLKRLEDQNYGEDQEQMTQGASQENSSPESLSPGCLRRTAENLRFEEWSSKLLRKGESALASADTAPIWVDNTWDYSSSYIPHWLAKDADLQSAAKALRCGDVSSASKVYEECLLSKTGADALSKKDRATRARRQITVIDTSDVDSENGMDGSNDDPSFEFDNFSENESDAEQTPNDEQVTEKQLPMKSKSKGLLKGWTGSQAKNAPLSSADARPVISASLGSAQVCHGSGSSKPAPTNHEKKLPSGIQKVISTQKFVHVSGGADFLFNGSTNVWGATSSQVPSSVTSKKPRFNQMHGVDTKADPNSVATGSSVVPGRCSGAMQTSGKTKSSTTNRSRVRSQAGKGARRAEKRLLPRIDPHQTMPGREKFVVSSVPTRAFVPASRGTWDPRASPGYTQVQKSTYGSAPHDLSEVGLPVGSVGSVVFAMGHRAATTQAAMSSWNSHITTTTPDRHCIAEVAHGHENTSGVFPNRSGSTQGNGEPSGTGMSPRTTTSTQGRPVDRMYPHAYVPNKPATRQTIVLTSSDSLEVLSSSEVRDDFWFVDNGIATEETVSVRPVALKKEQKDKRESGRESGNGVTCNTGINYRKDSRERKIDSQTQNWKNSVDDGVGADVSDAVLPSRKPSGTAQFVSQVERLREMTNVLDAEFLADVLLDCDYDINAAKDMVLRQIN